VADVYDALTTKRFYKEAFSHAKARQIILELRGSHFDPAVVDAFSAIEGELDRIRQEKLNQERKTVMPVDECYPGSAMLAAASS
jgi:HD-GYP domain-containing protein (c-di-GMP phosphodiesterase class II)